MTKQKGITLIALIVTIIVLIILAGISINLILGDNGIITKAQESRRVQEIAEIKSDIQLEIMAKEAEVLPSRNKITMAQIEEILGKYGTVNKDGETIISLTPNGKDYEIPFEKIYSGLSSVEHTGLYYGQPYSIADLDGNTYKIVFYEEMTYDIYVNDLYSNTGEYTILDNGNISVIVVGSTIELSISGDGSKIVVVSGSLASIDIGAELVLNAEKHGIYFGKKYSITNGGITESWFLYENGGVVTSSDGGYAYVPEGTLIYNGNSISIDEDGDGISDSIFYVSLDGTQIILPQYGIASYKPIDTKLYFNQPYNSIDNLGNEFTIVFAEDFNVYQYNAGSYLGSSAFTINEDGSISFDGLNMTLSDDGTVITISEDIGNGIKEFVLNTEKIGIHFGEEYSINLAGADFDRIIFNENGSITMRGENIDEGTTPEGYVKYYDNEIIETSSGLKFYVSFDGTQIIVLGEAIYTYSPY